MKPGAGVLRRSRGSVATFVFGDGTSRRFASGRRPLLRLQSEPSGPSSRSTWQISPRHFEPSPRTIAKILWTSHKGVYPLTAKSCGFLKSPGALPVNSGAVSLCTYGCQCVTPKGDAHETEHKKAKRLVATHDCHYHILLVQARGAGGQNRQRKCARAVRRRVGRRAKRCAFAARKSQEPARLRIRLMGDAESVLGRIVERKGFVHREMV